MSKQPVMLYYGKIHHSHEAMADSINAELIQVDAGSAVNRILAARRLNLDDQPVITEGGIPLFQAAWMDVFGNCGPVFHLAADEAIMNIFNQLDHYTLKDRFAHGWAHRHVDAVLAVSPRLVSEARAYGVGVTKLIHPFPEESKWQSLKSLDPDLTSDQVLAVGSNRPKNNFDMLQSIADRMENEVHFTVIGPNTDNLTDSNNVTGHGFVSEKKFLDLYRSSAAFVLPAVSQPFPVSSLEALRAGLPPFVTESTGTAPFILKIHPRMVTGVSSTQVAASLDWYFEQSAATKATLSKNTAEMGERFSPVQGRETFRIAYVQAMDEIAQ